MFQVSPWANQCATQKIPEALICCQIRQVMSTVDTLALQVGGAIIYNHCTTVTQRLEVS